MAIPDCEKNFDDVVLHCVQPFWHIPAIIGRTDGRTRINIARQNACLIWFFQQVTQPVVKVVLWSRGGGSPDEARLEQTPYPFQPH